MPKRKRPRPSSSNANADQQQQPQQRSQSSASAEQTEREKTRSQAKPKRKKGNKHNLLKGLTLSVTTLDEKRADSKGGNDSTTGAASSYKHTIDICRRYGASITRQVHKRVHALIVSDAAVENSTQRVRKAIKLCVPIVDAGWIAACADSGARVDWTEYLRNDEARQAAERKKVASGASSNASGGADGCDVEFDIGIDDANAASGWTDAIELDCCCVCHENGDLECPWCTGEKECNLTQRRLGGS